MNFFEYTSSHFIWLDSLVWLAIVLFTFASLIKGSDRIRAKTGYWSFWMFRNSNLFIILMACLFLYQNIFYVVPIFLIDLLTHISILFYLAWQFIYKRIIKKDWYGLHGQTTRNQPIFAQYCTKQSTDNSNETKLANAKRVLSELQGKTGQKSPMV